MIRIFNHYVSKMAFILLLLELAILVTAASLAGALMPTDSHGSSDLYHSSVAFALVVLFSMSALGMYQGSGNGMKTTLGRLTPSFALGFALLHALVALRPEVDPAAINPEPGEIALVFLLGAAGVVLTRLVVYRSARSELLEARLLFIGSGQLARECMELARGRAGFHRFRVIGCVPVPGEDECVSETTMLAPGESLAALARRLNATEIVVAVANRRNASYPARQLLDCALDGVRVIDSATFFEREACQIRVDSLQPS